MQISSLLINENFELSLHTPIMTKYYQFDKILLLLNFDVLYTFSYVDNTKMSEEQMGYFICNVRLSTNDKAVVTTFGFSNLDEKVF